MSYTLSEVTIVSAFFDLSSREERPRHSQEYLKLAEHILQLPINLFIVADDHLTPHFWKYRKEKGLLDKTFIYPLPLENSPYYRYRSEIEKAYRAGRRPRGLSPIKDTPLYIIVSWTKLCAIQYAIKLNPFKSECIMWIDMGLFHLYPQQIEDRQVQLLEDLQSIPKQKLKVMLIQDTLPSEIENRTVFYSKRQCKVIGGLFGGALSLMAKLCKDFALEVETCMASGYPSQEEALLSVLYAKNKSAYELCYGIYDDLITNFIYYRNNFNIILQCNLRYCRDNLLWPEVVKICQYIDHSVIKGLAELSPAQKIYLYDDYLVGAWYVNKELSLYAAKQIIDLFGQHSELSETFGVDHINSNLGYHELQL